MSSTPVDPSTAPIELRPHEVIAVIGDSITQQNLYTAVIETFLIARMPGLELSCWNLGWGGDVAPGGHLRYQRDVAPVAPTMVLVNFGMNDGCYGPPEASVHARWLVGVQDLVADIRASGARPVLMTTSAVDDAGRPALAPYNQTLEGFAQTLLTYAQAEGIAAIDAFHPCRDAILAARQLDPPRSLIPDGIHPDAAGHLVLAFAALQRFRLPAVLGTLTCSPGSLSAANPAVHVTIAATSQTHVLAEIELPFVPFWVPPEARLALGLVPFQEQVNRFVLDLTDWPDTADLAVTVDGIEVAIVSAAPGTRCVDLALLDQATWAVQGRELWSQAQKRFGLHALAWRQCALEDPPLVRAQREHRDLHAALLAYVRAGAGILSRLASPRRYAVEVGISQEVVLRGVEVSPLYPFASDQPGSFDLRHPPETDAASVLWTHARLTEAHLDLGAHFSAPVNCVCYVRIVLEAANPARVRWSLGSDDGLSLILNGHRLLARNVFRGCRLGDDQLECALPSGRSTVLLRVTQGGGGYGVAARVRLLSGGPVQQIPPV